MSWLINLLAHACRPVVARAIALGHEAERKRYEALTEAERRAEFDAEFGALMAMPSFDLDFGASAVEAPKADSALPERNAGAVR